MPPSTGTGSNPWDLERLSATGRQFLLEPQSRGNILRELQQRLEQEQQRRHEHQQLLRSSNNATDGQLQDDNEQGQQVKAWQESDEARRPVDQATAVADKENTENVVTRSEAVASAPAPPPPPPPPPPTLPKPVQKTKTNDISLPQTQLSLKRNDSQAESGGTGANLDKEQAQGQGSRASSITVFEEIKERHSKLLEEEEQGVTKKADKNDLPRISSRASPEEVNSLSTSEIFEEIQACRSDLLVASEEVQSVSPRLSAKIFLEETKLKSTEKYSPDRKVTSTRSVLHSDSNDLDNDVRSSWRSEPNSRASAGMKTGAQHDGPIRQNNTGRLSTQDVNEAEDAGMRHRLGRELQAADSPLETGRSGGSYRAPSPASESRESDGWDQADGGRSSSYLRLANAPSRFIETRDSMLGSDAAQQGSLRPAASVNAAPCLMCLMQCLRNSGLLGNRWKTAMFELEEAFALKAVADAAVAGTGEMTSSQQTYQQPYQQVYNEPPQQRGFDLPLATDGISKWQALERLCGLQNRLRNCSHACATEF